VQLLSDGPREGVRVPAIAALVSLDFNIVSRDVELTPASERLLIDRFHLDASAKVRARIVGGFGTGQAADSAPVRRLLTDAFGDSDYRVRHAAMSGAKKVDPETAVAFLVKELMDPNRTLRAQAASVLATLGPAASTRLSEIEQILQRETDPQVRQLLQAAVAATRR